MFRTLLALLCCLSCFNLNADSIQAALATETRPEADRALDSLRKPDAVLRFFDIQPGQRVLDVFGGGGYYTEILNHLVGAEGSVTLYNNNPWDNFVKQQVEERLKSNRLPNVEALTVEPHELYKVDAQYDAAIFVLGMHDIYYADEANGWPEINKSAFLAQLHRLVKPGGVFGVIDHNAQAGTDASVVGKDLHRVDPKQIIQDMEAAGFALEAASNALANPEDDLTESVFKPELRFKTDRSILKFRRN